MAFKSSSNCLYLHVLILCSSCWFSLKAQSSATADTISWGQSLSGDQTLVSNGSNFKLGFFRPGNSTNYYIGIWYNNRPERTVVWVLNRLKPVTNPSSSELRISEDGNLVLLNQSKIPIWSSDLAITASNSTTAALLDTGNFVLMNGSNSSMLYWQSFEHPTDSWLPKQHLGWNNRTKEYMTLVSWKSLDDPAPGLYSFGMDPRGSDQLVQIWNGSITYWTSGEWNGQYFSSVPELTGNNVYKFTYDATEKSVTYTAIFTTADLITRVVAYASGQLLVYAWLNTSTDWIVVWTQPKQQCQIYSLCGPFSICNNSGPFCSCLQGFEPAVLTDWNSGLRNGGCVRETQLQCQNKSADLEKDKFLAMPNVQLPVNSGSLAGGSAEECETACLNNCSCTGYANSTGSCLIWNGGLLNLQQPSGGNSTGTVFIRLAASEFKDSEQPQGSSGNHVALIVGVVGGFLAAFGLVLLFSWCYRRRRLMRMSNQANKGSLVVFSYRDLQSLTKNFSERLGGGGFGSVFKGMLPDSTAIAVKKLESAGQGEKQFRAEVSSLGTIQHVNLVRLRGFCCENNQRLLAYDYMSNGSLDSHLFSHNSKLLSWKDRYEIALRTARGLAYLHEQCRDCIIHCDIKPENILLDADFCPKVADFGMAKLMGREISRVLTTMRGTIGYLAPEWLTGVPITPKADVYSYGMVLFELISGTRNTTPNEGMEDEFFPVRAAKKVVEDDVVCLLDEKLEADANVEELRRLCRVACWCIQTGEFRRPSMGEVVQILERALEVNVPPIPSALQQLVFNEDSTEVPIPSIVCSSQA